MRFKNRPHEAFRDVRGPDLNNTGSDGRPEWVRLLFRRFRQFWRFWRLRRRKRCGAAMRGSAGRELHVLCQPASLLTRRRTTLLSLGTHCPTHMELRTRSLLSACSLVHSRVSEKVNITRYGEPRTRLHEAECERPGVTVAITNLNYTNTVFSPTASGPNHYSGSQEMVRHESFHYARACDVTHLAVLNIVENVCAFLRQAGAAVGG